MHRTQGHDEEEQTEGSAILLQRMNQMPSLLMFSPGSNDGILVESLADILPITHGCSQRKENLLYFNLGTGIRIVPQQRETCASHTSEPHKGGAQCFPISDPSHRVLGMYIFKDRRIVQVLCSTAQCVQLPRYILTGHRLVEDLGQPYPPRRLITASPGQVYP